MRTMRWIGVGLALLLGGATAQAAPAADPPASPEGEKRADSAGGEGVRKRPTKRLDGLEEKTARRRASRRLDGLDGELVRPSPGRVYYYRRGHRRGYRRGHRRDWRARYALTVRREQAQSSMSWGRWALWNGLTGFGVAALTVPATLALGHEIGKHPSSYIAAALPGLLLLLALPPAAVTTAEYLLGNRLKRGSARWHPAFWATLGVQLLTMVVAIAAGTTTHELGTVAAFSAADAVILSGSVTLMMYLTRPKRWRTPAPAAVALPTAGGRAALLSLVEERWLARRHRVQPTLDGGLVVNVLRLRF